MDADGKNSENPDETSHSDSVVNGAASPALTDDGYAFLTEEIVQIMIQRANSSGSFVEIIRTLGKIFSDYYALKQSFRRKPLLSAAVSSFNPDNISEFSRNVNKSSSLCASVKEALRARTEEDKDIDSSEPLRRESLLSVGSELDEVLLEHAVDLDAVRASYTLLFELKDKDGNVPSVPPFTNTIPALCDSIERDLRLGIVQPDDSGLVSLTVLLLELPILRLPKLASVLPPFFSLIIKLPISAQAKLAKTLAALVRNHPVDFHLYVHTVQEVILMRMFEGVLRDDYVTNEDQVVCNAARFLRVLFAVNLLAGDMEPRLDLPTSPLNDSGEENHVLASQACTNGTALEHDQDALRLMTDLELGENSDEASGDEELFCLSYNAMATRLLHLDDDTSTSTSGTSVPVAPNGASTAGDLRAHRDDKATIDGTLPGSRTKDGGPVTFSFVDPLLLELGINMLDCRQPLIALSEFYNGFISDILCVEEDYEFYRNGNSSEFSFLSCPFVLTPYTRAQALYLDSRHKMNSRRTLNFFSAFLHGEQLNPVLKLRVRRDHLVEDALVNLELVALENHGNLKKQLVVEFEGEQGVDEGGVSKEFFMLIVERLFNPDYGMFTLNEETHCYWFNPTSFEADAQFTLIGIIIGLAIYNNVILNVPFPMVVYRKLFGAQGTYRDLIDFSPAFSRGLHQMLVYLESDFDDVFCQTFRVTYKDVFGTMQSHDLKPDGDSIPVDHTNKVEFVELYADFLLNRQVERQFNAFKKGFELVTRDSPLTKWFQPEEVALLVCGQQDFDLNGLRQTCEYDGYDSDAEVIRWFWDVVHDMSDEEKKLLLQFTTGSDR